MIRSRRLTHLDRIARTSSRLRDQTPPQHRMVPGLLPSLEGPCLARPSPINEARYGQMGPRGEANGKQYGALLPDALRNGTRARPTRTPLRRDQPSPVVNCEKRKTRRWAIRAACTSGTRRFAVSTTRDPKEEERRRVDGLSVFMVPSVQISETVDPWLRRQKLGMHRSSGKVLHGQLVYDDQPRRYKRGSKTKDELTYSNIRQEKKRKTGHSEPR
ncbi:hypothetical protein H4582DRAFT_2132711 [Lactarius indigo]|nr:hypothetical protein H4582DRAFT_2132711 [Lactarius indigo]